MKFSKRLDAMSEYIFSRLAKKVKEVEKKSGRKILNLGAGVPDVPPSVHYVKKLREFVSQPDSHLYPGYGPTTEFRNAIQTWYQNRFKVALKHDEIYPLLGAKDGVSHLSMAILDAGDEVLVPDPGYPGFSGSALIFGAKPVTYNLLEENDFKPIIVDLEKNVTKKTKFIWLNFPSNPTGQVMSIRKLVPIVQFAKRHDLIIAYDNPYSELIYGNFVPPSILEINGAKERTVEIGSFSKTFSFAGYRIGWIVGNQEIISAVAKVKSHIDSGLWLSLQKLGAYALTHWDNKWYKKMIADYAHRKSIVAKHLKEIGLEFQDPKGALYIWAKIPSKYRNSEEYSLQLLENKQILVTPGTAFGENGKKYVRVSFCVNIDEIDGYFI